MKEESTRDVSELAVALSVALTRLRSRLRVESGMTTAGVTLSQLAIVQRILASGPTTAAELAAAEYVTQQAIAQSVAILKEGGLVSGERDEADGRRVLISVTDAGRALFDSLFASRTEWLARAISATVDEGELRNLETAIELLERLAGADVDHEASPSIKS